MDKHGVDIQAISLSTEVFYGFSPDETAEICRIANDANYTLCKAYPKRFVNVCAISLLDVKSGLRELDRSINELDCRAVIVSTNQDGKGLDSPDYDPFYKKLVEHDLPLLLHPTYWKSYPLADESEWTIMSRFGWPFDSTQAVWRMIFGGVFDRFPTLKVVMHHMPSGKPSGEAELLLPAVVLQAEILPAVGMMSSYGGVIVNVAEPVSSLAKAVAIDVIRDNASALARVPGALMPSVRYLNVPGC